jgi:transposase
MKSFLTSSEVAELRARHRSEQDGKVRDRIKAVLLADDGWSCRSIATALIIHEETVAKHLANYIDLKKLELASGGSKERLSGPQIKMLLAHLEQKLYDKASGIAAWVKQQFGVIYSTQGMTEVLHRHGFSWKYPVGTPAKADLAAQAAFCEEYEKLRDSLPKDEIIVFSDASHPTMATKVGKGWIRTGKDFPIATVASRTRVNVLGSIDLNGLKFVGTAHETVNSETVVAHFKELRKANHGARVIHMILDQSGYNTSQKTKESAAEFGIVLHFLPAYSPNLNPIERLWKILSEQVRKNRVFADAKEFKREILGFFTDTWPKLRKKMRGRINDNFQTLQPAF